MSLFPDASAPVAMLARKPKLDLGDCFACACTRRHGATVLFRGEDFIHTDHPDAMLP